MQTAVAQQTTNDSALAVAAKRYNESFQANWQRAKLLAKTKGWSLRGKHKGGIALMGVNPFGRPIYYSTFNNIIAAATVKTDQLWAGGSLGLGLSGASAALKNKLAIWDGAGVLNTHVELVGRVTQKDGAFVSGSDASSHATHVTGTMMAAGINPLVKGMSYGLQGLWAYDFGNDRSEMAAAANNLLLSNHSYGTICGWFQDSDGSWIFMGNDGDNEDYNFGYYDQDAAAFDNIAYNAPYYLIVRAAGNSRDQNGPAVGKPYYYYDNAGTKLQGIRPLSLSSNNGYGIIGTSGNAKNILTVGAVNGIPAGYNRKEDVVMSSFSSWGPTDDGRIKPDLVADGVNVLSLSSTGKNDYMVESGTSMSAPNATGSLLLLQELYDSLYPGAFMRAATLKGLAIHTADEAGTDPGPDYRFGWGLLNTQKAASLILASAQPGNLANKTQLLLEKTLLNNQHDTIRVVTKGNMPLTATLSWTDPAGNVETINVLNNPASKLVNDLDLRIEKGSQRFFPWILSPAIPAAAATTGDNTLDNVEKIEVNNVLQGQVYEIIVSHKASLSNGAQAYSLLVSGVGGNAYCTIDSNASSATRVDSVAFGGINDRMKLGCTRAYLNRTAYTAYIKSGQTIPIYFNAFTCGINPFLNYGVKVFIDYNGNGSFDEPSEAIVTGSIPIGKADFQSTITTPANLIVGTNTLMRIVVAATDKPDTLSACYNLNNGGIVLDYRVAVLPPDNDMGVTSITAPVAGSHPSGNQLLTIAIKNKGNVAQQNIPLAATVYNGGVVVAQLNGLYPSTIPSGATVHYTFQTPFATLPGVSYTIAASTLLANDENKFNDTLLQQRVLMDATVAATANACNGTTYLRVIQPQSSTGYAWYKEGSSNTPFATDTLVAQPTDSKASKVYLSAGASGKLGPVTKGTSAGGYQTLGNNYLYYSSTADAKLESVHLYTRYPGTITIMAADIFNPSSAGYNYNTLSSKQIDVYATHPNPSPNSVDGNDAADQGADFAVGLDLPAGDHAIIITSNDASLFRNTSLPSGRYPFQLSNWFSITGNGAINPNNAADTTFYRSFYYYLYDMKVTTIDCKADHIPIAIENAPTPRITYVGDSLVCSLAGLNQWYLDGVAINGATGRTYKPSTTAGSYTVVSTDRFGCAKQSPAFNIERIVPIVAGNPSNTGFQLSFYAKNATDIALALVGASGKSGYQKTFSQFQGNFAATIPTGQLAAGVYVLEIRHTGGVERKKILVMH